MALALISSRRNWGSRAQTPIFEIENQHVLVQMAQARPSPSLARARFWKSKNLEIQKFGIQKLKRMKILKIQIRSAQNVGKVWISRKKTFPAQFGATPGCLFHGPNKSKNNKSLPIFLGGLCQHTVPSYHTQLTCRLPHPCSSPVSVE